MSARASTCELRSHCIRHPRSTICLRSFPFSPLRPVRTFDTACFYYHLFRLCHRDVEYNYQDAALASLFLACKVEDTIKKSREILCAAYNIKNAEYPTTQDDKVGLLRRPYPLLAMES